MIRERLALGTLAVAMASMSPLTLSTHAQDFGEQSIKQSFPVETHPRVSEKDYKAALEKIPAPAEKCDPWGNARSAEPTKPGKKSN